MGSLKDTAKKWKGMMLVTQGGHGSMKRLEVSGWASRFFEGDGWALGSNS